MLSNRWGGALAGIPLQIDFLGIFDTVASVGLAHSTPPVLGQQFDGHGAWAEGQNMVVPPTSSAVCTLLPRLKSVGRSPWIQSARVVSCPRTARKSFTQAFILTWAVATLRMIKAAPSVALRAIRSSRRKLHWRKCTGRHAWQAFLVFTQCHVRLPKDQLRDFSQAARRLQCIRRCHAHRQRAAYPR